MKKIIQYWYTDGQNITIETQPPKNKYNYNYMIKYKIQADSGHILYNIRTKNIEKTINIFPNYESEWIELSYEELEQQDK